MTKKAEQVFGHGMFGGKLYLPAYWNARRAALDLTSNENGQTMRESMRALLGGRLTNVMYRAGLSTVREISTTPDWLLLTIPNFSVRALTELRQIIPFEGDPQWARLP